MRFSLYHCYAIMHNTLILNEMKKDQFTHNLAKAKRQAKKERQNKALNDNPMRSLFAGFAEIYESTYNTK